MGSNLTLKNNLNNEFKIENTDNAKPITVTQEDLANSRMVNSIADLVALDDNNQRGKVYVKDYHSDTEGGGGTFVWDGNKPKSEHNGGIIINPTQLYPSDWSDQVQLNAWFNDDILNEYGCWVRQYDGAVNVKWFGVKGDGITDNTISYTAMINGLPEHTEIEWATATYKGSFESATKAFKLTGNNSTLIKADGSFFAISFIGTVGNSVALSVAPSYGDTTLSGITGLTEDTLVYLYSGTQRPSDSQPVNYEVIKVRPDGTVYDKVYSEQNGGTPTYVAITPIKGVVIDGFNVDGELTNTYGVFLKYVENARVSNIKMVGGSTTTVAARFAYNCTIDHVSRIKPSATGSGQGYNVAFYVAKYCKTLSVYGEETRHDYDQDSAYSMYIDNVISIDCKSSAITIAHNGFAGATTVKDCTVSKCNSYAVATSRQAVTNSYDVIVRDCIIDNIKISNSIILNTYAFYVGIYFQTTTENCTIANISFDNLSDTEFDYVGGTYNTAYHAIRIASIKGQLNINNIQADSVTNLINIDRSNENASTYINISNINVVKFRDIILINSTFDNRCFLSVENLNFYESSLVYGRSLVFNNDSFTLKGLMIRGLSDLPNYTSLVGYLEITSVPYFSEVDTAGFMKRLASLNNLIAGGTITQRDYLTRGEYAIWGSTSKTLSTTEPIARPITGGNIFGITNYGTGELTIPRNTDPTLCTVYGSTPLVIGAGEHVRFMAKDSQWMVLTRQTGVTIS